MEVDENGDGDGHDGETDEGLFVVERILARGPLYDRSGEECGDGFLVRWEGYGPEDDTWEPRSGLEEGSAEMIRLFESERQSKSIKTILMTELRASADGPERPLRITVLDRRGYTPSYSYHVRFCGAEGSDDYSPHAVMEWKTVLRLEAMGLSKEDVRTAIQSWEASRLPTPPASSSSRSWSTSTFIDVPKKSRSGRSIKTKIKSYKLVQRRIKTEDQPVTVPSPRSGLDRRLFQCKPHSILSFHPARGQADAGSETTGQSNRHGQGQSQAQQQTPQHEVLGLAQARPKGPPAQGPPSPHAVVYRLPPQERLYERHAAGEDQGVHAFRLG